MRLSILFFQLSVESTIIAGQKVFFKGDWPAAEREGEGGREEGWSERQRGEKATHSVTAGLQQRTVLGEAGWDSTLTGVALPTRALLYLSMACKLV